MSTDSGSSTLVAGDIGGTKTLLGLFDGSAPRPRPIVVRTFGTLEFEDLPSMLETFLREPAASGMSIDAACFGVAGPVLGEAATLTNVPWHVDAGVVRQRFGFRRVGLLNDLEAMAHSIAVLQQAELHVLQEGVPVANGNMALIAAGTGLGEALIHHVNGRPVPSPTEAGHADFAARTEREIDLVRALTKKFGRVENERIISGRGLVNIFPFVHRGPCQAAVSIEHPDAAAAISSAALDRRCDGCVEALDVFVEAYGAEAGNLALRTAATGGVFVGGGIAPKVMPAMTSGSFLRAFRAKSPLDDLVGAIPVKIILNPEAGLLGAASFAAHLTR